MDKNGNLESLNNPLNDLIWLDQFRKLDPPVLYDPSPDSMIDDF